MTAVPGMRDLAHHLLSYEAASGKTSEQMECTTLRVYEKLRQSLGQSIGVASFQSLASRALTLAKLDAPSLGAARVTADGSLLGLREPEIQIDMDKDQAGDGGIVLIACLLGLLRTFLGEALTLRLLRNAWPGEAFDDSSSAHGRKS